MAQRKAGFSGDDIDFRRYGLAISTIVKPMGEFMR